MMRSPIGRVLIKVLADAFRDRRLHGALDVGVAELGLGLALELGIGQLDADDRGQPLAHVVAGEVGIGVLDHAWRALPSR